MPRKFFSGQHEIFLYRPNVTRQFLFVAVSPISFQKFYQFTSVQLAVRKSSDESTDLRCFAPGFLLSLNYAVTVF